MYFFNEAFIEYSLYSKLYFFRRRIRGLNFRIKTVFYGLYKKRKLMKKKWLY